MKMLLIVVTLVLVACGGSPTTAARRAPVRTDGAKADPSDTPEASDDTTASTTQAKIGSSQAPVEEPNPDGASCADRNPKKCLEEADAAFDVGHTRKAVALLTRACDLDEPDGCHVLGQAYTRGAIENNPAEGTKFFVRWGQMLEAGCDKDDAEHIARCGRMADYYAKGSEPDFINGVAVRLVKKDEARASALYKKLLPKREVLCDQADAEACFHAGKQYEKGLGVTADEVEAKKLFASSCKQKHPAGCTSAGMLEDACGYGDVSACDKLCEGGNDRMCEKASPAVKGKAEKRIAKAKLPGLFTKCMANRAEVEKWRIAGVQAAKAKNMTAAEKAVEKMKEIEAGWSATLSELRSAIDLAADDGLDRMTLMKQVREKCSCDRDPLNPGPCKKAGD